MPDTSTLRYFELFNEIAIIEQLSRTLLEERLPEGLISPHFTVLNHLTRVGDGRAPIDIARAFQVPKTSMTHTLKVLEARGLIAIRPNPQDGRSKLVWLTDAGHQVRADTIKALGPDIARIAERFGHADLDAVLPVLKKLRIHLDAARDQKHADAKPSAPRQPAI
ncbi:MAG: MarR family winged helix-turn-helix transcriptional regulator [Roseobacter sp.]